MSQISLPRQKVSLCVGGTRKEAYSLRLHSCEIPYAFTDILKDTPPYLKAVVIQVLNS